MFYYLLYNDDFASRPSYGVVLTWFSISYEDSRKGHLSCFEMPFKNNIYGISVKLVKKNAQFFSSFQEHVNNNPPNKILEVDEFLALRKEVKHMLKHDGTSDSADKPDVPPGEDTEEVVSQSIDDIVYRA